MALAAVSLLLGRNPGSGRGARCLAATDARPGAAARDREPPHQRTHQFRGWHPGHGRTGEAGACGWVRSRKSTAPPKLCAISFVGVRPFRCNRSQTRWSGWKRDSALVIPMRRSGRSSRSASSTTRYLRNKAYSSALIRECWRVPASVGSVQKEIDTMEAEADSVKERTQVALPRFFLRLCTPSAWMPVG